MLTKPLSILKKFPIFVSILLLTGCLWISGKITRTEFGPQSQQVTYTGSPFSLRISTAYTAQSPNLSGISNCAVSPSLPAGLIMNSDCSFSGTPTAFASQATYSVTGAASSLQIFGSFLLSVIGISGSLDTRWNTTGKSTTTVTGNNDALLALTALSDGSVIGVGYTNNGADDRPMIVKYLSTGTLDPAFGTAGTTIITTFAGIGARYQAVEMQSDGKILAGGYHNNGGTQSFLISRFNTDGSLDTGFGTTGHVIYLYQLGANFVRSISVLSDGKFLIGGRAQTAGPRDKIAILKYDSTGVLDPAFGTAGGVVLGPLANDYSLGGMTVQSDDKIFIVGYHNIVNIGAIVARILSDGSLDPSFAGGGITNYNLAGSVEMYLSNPLQLSDGKYLVSGSYKPFGFGDFDPFTAKFNSDGSSDATYGTGGVTGYRYSNQDESNCSKCFYQQSDGKFLIGAVSYNGANNDFSLIRINSDGTTDNTYGASGFLLIPVGAGNDSSNGMAVRSSDGTVILGGSYTNGANEDLAVVSVWQ